MNTHNNFMQMEHSNHGYNAGNGISLLVGFILAFSNSVTGWLAKINIGANLDGWVQAFILGFIGSTATFFTNKFWKYITEKKKKKSKE